MRKIVVFLTVFGAMLLSSISSYAQIDDNAQGVGVTVPIEGVVPSGSLICSATNGYELCDEEYTPRMFAVVTNSAAASIASSEIQNPYVVIPSGNVLVRVTATNGPIEEGSLITSSEVEGVAQLADQNGFALGTALERFSPANPDVEGTIMVSINIHATAGISGARTDLLRLLRRGLGVTVLDPLSTMRYLLAAIVIIVSFVLGFAYFGRVSRAGIDALGRNPTASRAITLSILMNVIVTIVIIFVGLIVSYLILVL